MSDEENPTTLASVAAESDAVVEKVKRGRPKKAELTVEEHAENVQNLKGPVAYYALLSAVEMTASYVNSQGRTRQVAGMEILLADMVQKFCYTGGKNGIDPDLSKSTAVVKIIMGTAMTKLAAVEPPVCEADGTPLMAGDGVRGKFLICLSCGGSHPIHNAFERQDWYIAQAAGNKLKTVEPKEDEPELLKCVDDGIAMTATQDATGKLFECPTCHITDPVESDEDLKAWNAAWAAQNREE